MAFEPMSLQEAVLRFRESRHPLMLFRDPDSRLVSVIFKRPDGQFGLVETAKAMCRGCAVRLACLAGALERQEPWGVWGGELFLRGTVVPRKRPRGRPRKTDVAA